MEQEYYSTKDAAEKALEWCSNHKGWIRICDLKDDVSTLYKTWEELSERERKTWIKQFGETSAKDAWEEFGIAPCKVEYGFISGKGEFYKKVTEVPLYHNLMEVYKIE